MTDRTEPLSHRVTSSRAGLALSVAAFTLAGLAAACGGKDASATGEAAQQAMSLYAKGFNALVADPKKMVTDYFDAIPAEGPAALTKPRLPASHTFVASSIKEARDAFAAAGAAAPPSMAGLAAPAERAIATIDKIQTTFTAAHGYYESDSYKDDKLARGQQLHADMVALSRDLDAAVGELEDGLTAIEDAQAATDLEAHAADKSYGYWFRFYTIEAKRFVRALEDARTAEQRAGLAAALAPLTEASQGLEAFVTGKGAGIAQAFNGYTGSARSLHALATKVVRDLGEAEPPPTLRQDLDMLYGAYNNLITAGNSLYKVEAAGGLR
jgi:hypothetical protein